MQGGRVMEEACGAGGGSPAQRLLTSAALWQRHMTSSDHSDVLATVGLLGRWHTNVTARAKKVACGGSLHLYSGTRAQAGDDCTNSTSRATYCYTSSRLLASVLRRVEIGDDCKHARQQLLHPLLAVQRQGGGGRLLRYRDTGRHPTASQSTKQRQLLHPQLAICTAAGWGWAPPAPHRYRPAPSSWLEVCGSSFTGICRLSAPQRETWQAPS